MKTGIFANVQGLLFRAVFFIAPLSALAAPQQFCDNYATSAIHQYQQARAMGMAAPPPVWSDNYNHHYNWCLHQNERVVQQGFQLRQSQLEDYGKHTVKKTVPVSPAPKVATAVLQAKVAVPVSIGGLHSLSKKSYTTHFPVRAGVRPYIDRNFSYKKLPPELINSVLIQTANEDKFSSDRQTLITFSVDKPVTLYVAYDKRYRNRPGWLGNFQATGAEALVDAGGGSITQVLYKRRFPAGRLKLGGNLPAGQRENFSMYSLFVAADKGNTATAAGKTPRQTLQRQVAVYRNKFDAMAVELADYNARIDKAVRNNVLAIKRDNAKAFATLPSPQQIANAVVSATPTNGRAYDIDLRDYVALPQKKGEAIRLGKKNTGKVVSLLNMQGAVVAPQALRPIDPASVQVDGIARVTSFPGLNGMQPGDWVYVSGVGFGTAPGTISLDYLVKLGEFDSQWTQHTVTVDPKADKVTWRNNLIVFRLPASLPDVNKAAQSAGKGIGNAALSFRFANGSKATRKIKLRPRQILLQDIWTDSSLQVTERVSKTGYRWVRYSSSGKGKQVYQRYPNEEAAGVARNTFRSIEPGSDVYLAGSGFGDQPGTIEIVADGKSVPVIPAGGKWWSDFGIHFKVGNVPGIRNRHEATLRIVTAAGLSLYNSQFAFVYGPEQTLKVVSGRRWFEPEWDEDSSFAKEDKKDLTLFVSHDPGCGWFSTSESGWDHFFRAQKLPAGVSLDNYLFVELRHEDADDQMRFLKNYLKDLLFSLDGLGFLDAALGVITQNLKMAVQAGIDYLFGDGGGYYAYQPVMPDATKASPTISVKWENACTGANAGLPIMYLTTFVISGPKTTLDAL